MKYMQFMMAAALVMAAALTGFGADVQVKVTGTGGDCVTGYYVAYEINGIPFRSDQIGQKINQIAWDHMNDEDKDKTLNAFGWMLNERQSQFGEASQSMALYANIKGHWTEAYEVLENRLAARDFPGYKERFEDPFYFDNFFLPKCAKNSDFNSYPELQTMFLEEELVFSWAVEAYQSMVKYDLLKTQAAVRQLSGDLISLITDKCLVPNITPAGSSGMVGEIVGAVLDQVNNLTDFSGKAIEMAVGERPSASATRAVMDKLSQGIDADAEIIRICVRKAHEIQEAIDARYLELRDASAAQDRARQAQDAANRQEVESVTTEGPPDAVIAGEVNTLTTAVASAQKRLAEINAALEKATGDDRGTLESQRIAQEKVVEERKSERDQRKKEIENEIIAAFDAFRIKYVGETFDPQYPGNTNRCGGLIKELLVKLDGEKSKWPTCKWWKNDMPSSTWISNRYPWMLLADSSDVAALSADIGAYCEEIRALGERRSGWLTEAKELAKSVRADFDAILSDIHGLRGENGDLQYVYDKGEGFASYSIGVVEFGNIIVKVAGIIAGADWADARIANLDDFYTGVIASTCDLGPRAAEEEERLRIFMAERERLLAEIEVANRRYQDATLAYTWAVGEYNTAWRNLTAIVANTPDYVKNLASYSWMPDFTLTELPKSGYMESETLLFQRFVVSGATGTVADAQKIRQELNEYCDKVAGYKQRMESMKRKAQFYWTQVKEYASAFQAITGYYDLDEYFRQFGSGLTPLSALEGTFVERSIPASLYAAQRRASIKAGPRLAADVVAEPEMPANAQTLIGLARLLQRDFNNRSQTFCSFIEAFADLCDNSETYTTNVGTNFDDDPFLRMYASEFPQWSSLRGRGAHSYAYWIPGYYAAEFAAEPDPYEFLVAPLAEEIAEVRANGGEPVNPTPPNPPTDPTESAPELYASPASTPFTGNANYNGWVRGADGAIVGLLTIKAGKAAKPEKGGQSKLTIQYTPFGGKKQTIKLDKSRFPVAGGNPTVNIPDLGAVTFGGTSLAGTGLQMGKDLAKSKDKAEKAAANARLASKNGVWTFAFGAAQGYAAFSVTVKKGKGKLTGTLPDGTKVSVSSQGILGDKALAIPFVYSKKGALGFVFWVNDDGTTSISDLTALKLANGTTLAVKEQVAPSAALKLADGTRTFTVSGLGVTQAFAVAGRKWTLPKHVKKPTEEKPDLNPSDVKLKFTEKTGVVKGSFSVPNPVTGKAVKYTVNGVVVDGVLYGAAFMKGGTPVACEAE